MGWRRRHGNPDQGQDGIVDLVRDLPASVQLTTGVGDGFADLVIGFQGLTVLSELKAPGKKAQLRPSQEKFRREWRGGPVLVADDGMDLVQQLIQLDIRTPPVRGVQRNAAKVLLDECLKAADGLIVDADDLPGLIRKLRGAL